MSDLDKALAAALDAAPCVCGEPTLGVVHRADGPCYLPEQAPPAAAVPDGYAPVPVEPTTMAFALPDGKYALYTAPPPRRNVTYVCPVCAASLERQE